MMASSTTPAYTLLLLGDVMLGRLIDQLLPSSVPSQEDASHAASFRQRHPHLSAYTHLSPFGNAPPLLKSSSLVLANLETAATLHPDPWPNKVFNYRTHPANIRSIVDAGISYVSLANNHTLDFQEPGLLETVQAVHEAGIAHAGAGTTAEQASQPAVLYLPRPDVAADPFQVHCYSFSDHPADWSHIPLFNHITYSAAGRAKLKAQLLAPTTTTTAKKPALKVVSMHWGPNYAWHPSREIRDLARWLVNECDVDLVHGHSSHHVQGVEVLRRRGSENKKALVVYGCGDFVDDYAVNGRFRNDLSAAWRVSVQEVGGGAAAGGGRDEERGRESGGGRGRLEITKLEVFPNRIKTFQGNLLAADDEDHRWVTRKFRELCEEMGTQVDEELGPEGEVVVRIT